MVVEEEQIRYKIRYGHARAQPWRQDHTPITHRKPPRILQIASPTSRPKLPETATKDPTHWPFYFVRC
ncbi:hypothetical protein HZ326_0053 [Fusarium oxysporum f. sp. albedinis]|nr:hypothetical protein HZ326_0053 [Fusarium oxysporum f. sp. albedinis]